MLVRPGPGILVAGALVPMAMTAVPVTVVAEEMHQRTGKQQQVRQDSEHVGSVLGDQKESGDDQEADQYELPPGIRRIAVVSVVMIHMHTPSRSPLS